MVDNGTSTDYQRRGAEKELRSDLNERIREALGRAYCTERNKHKVLDPDLIEDMVTELTMLITVK